MIEWIRNGNIEGQTVPLERPNQYAHLAINGIDRWPLLDTIDSVLVWTAYDGTLLNQSSYDPFGQVLDRDPNWPAAFGFAGYWYDSNSEVYQLMFRAYHPRFGCLLQKDPLGLADGTNLYSYCHHSPGTFTDYWGLTSNDVNWDNVGRAATTIGLGIAAAVGGLFLISNPVGWIALAGAMSLATGVAGVGVGATQLATSQSRNTRQDIEMTAQIRTALSISSSPGSLIGASTSLIAGGSAETGAMYGGLAELGGVGISAGVSALSRVGEEEAACLASQPTTARVPWQYGELPNPDWLGGTTNLDIIYSTCVDGYSPTIICSKC